MILADKIIRLRKKNGWTQEELAEKMKVSRQAVAKWEGAQTIPDLGKILQLGELFGVTTDYLLKDELEEEEFIDSDAESNIKHVTKRVTLEEANEFLAWRQSASVKIAAAAFLCIFSVIPLILLGAAAESGRYGISDAFAGAAGLGVLFIIIAAAAAIFIFCGFRNTPYEFLDKEAFETEYGVEGMVRERQKAYKATYAKMNIIGTCICIISPVPLFSASFADNDFLIITMLSATLLLAGIGVIFFIIAGVRWASMQKLLKEGEYGAGKERNRIKEAVGSVYWLTAAAVYLGWSFLTNDWKISWIVWPIAGILYAGVMTVCNLFTGREHDRE